MIATFLLLTQLQFASTTLANKSSNYLPFKIDTSNSCVFELTEKNSWRISGAPLKSVLLSSSDYELISSLLQSTMTYNLGSFEYLYPLDFQNMIYFNHDEFINKILSEYDYQLVPFIDIYGYKRVWINCIYHGKRGDYFCKSIPMIHDGGSYYFNFMVNLSKLSFYDFSVNGEA